MRRSVSRVAVFIDYQNVHLSAHELFCRRGMPLRLSHISPLALGRLLASRRPWGGELVTVRVYRGQPSAALQNDYSVSN